MSTLRMNATELRDTDVDFVALVKRGANRLPFRITKGDEEMDLYAIGRKFLTKADAAPAVVAIVTRKEDAQSPFVVELAKACGLDLTKLDKSEEGEIITLTKADAPKDGLIVVKLDDTIGVVVAGSKLKDGFANFDFKGTAFEKLDGSQGVCASLDVAAAIHKAEVAELVAKTDALQLTQALTKSGETFAQYHGVLTAYLPDPLKKSVGTGNATGGAGMNQETGDGLGDKANTKGATQKADGGKNGSGEGFERGKGTGTNASATADDKANTEVNSTGESTVGDLTGLPDKAKAKKDGSCDGDTDPAAKKKAKKAELINGVVDALKKALSWDPDGDGDDDITQTGESAAGEGAAQAATDTSRAVSHGSADDANAGGKVAGKVKGKTLDMSGIPAGVSASTAKNDGDGDVGKKGKGETLPEGQSGAGAQEKDVQTLKAEDAVLRMVQELAKSVQASTAAVTKTVEALSQRVEGVAALAKKTDAALQGTVFNEEGEDRQPARTAKSDREDQGIPLLDTGLSRRRA